MIFAKNFARNYEKNIILGTSEAWSMSHSSQRPSDPSYYIEDCRIFSNIIDVPDGITFCGRRRKNFGKMRSFISPFLTNRDE